MKHTAVAALLLTCLATLGASATGIFIPATSPRDVTYDAKRQVVYITSQDSILRYNLQTASFDTPLTLGGQLVGLDISPDGSTLAAADSDPSSSKQLHLVSLDTDVDRPASSSSIGDSFDSYSVGYLKDGDLLATTSYGSLDTSLRVIDPVDLHQKVVAISVLATEMNVSVSGDGMTAAYVESGYDPGRWAIYKGKTGDLTSPFSDPDFAADLFEIGVDHDGSQFVVPTSFGAFTYDSAFHRADTKLGQNSSAPLGIAYAPVDPIAYMPWEGTDEVRAYDMQTWTLLTTYHTGQTAFVWPGGAAFTVGRTRLSRDGSVLMVTVYGGVEVFQLYAPLGADDVAASSNGSRTQIQLAGHIGNGATPSYGVQTPPTHGKVFVDGDKATYIPAPGFSGQDSFVYAAHYGLAVASATVTIDVTADTSAYQPRVAFDTLPVLQATTPIPGSTRVPGDFNGDGISDLLWYNPTQSEIGYWTMAPSSSGSTNARRTGAKVFNVSPGYVVAAEGDFDGDGYTDLMFTSPARDLWLWTNNRAGGWHSTRSYDYPGAWQLIGAGDVDGDGKDDLLWLDPTDCKFAYWLMDGAVRKGSRVMDIACGYYPIGIGYYTPGNRISILWSSAANDLYMWDSTGASFRSYDLGSTLDQPWNSLGMDRIWAIGGGYAGGGIGIEWNGQDRRFAKGALLTRTFDAQGRQTGSQISQLWRGGLWADDPQAAAYLIRGGSSPATALYSVDAINNTIQTGGFSNGDPSRSGTAPRTLPTEWTYPAGWQLVGSPGNRGLYLPWR